LDNVRDNIPVVPSDEDTLESFEEEEEVDAMETRRTPPFAEVAVSPEEEEEEEEEEMEDEDVDDDEEEDEEEKEDEKEDEKEEEEEVVFLLLPVPLRIEMPEMPSGLDKERYRPPATAPVELAAVCPILLASTPSNNIL
tara:strand:- start:336 stop:752 length:417 start_codon:yes stop_codon:yes gene_type:complete